MSVYNILEIANTHGGNINYILSLIKEFEEFAGYGIKFQPLHPDMIATKDYDSYKVYQELYFKETDWEKIIDEASKTKEIWIDLFDHYGIKIFLLNKEKIKGIKFQSSILFNDPLINELSKHNLEDITLALNVSGYEIGELKERLSFFESKLKPKEIWLEVGFQAYPTVLEDSALVKIQAIKDNFTNKIVFADHADAEGENTIWLPVIAALKGASALEKHIKHSSLETKYDYFSSVDVNKYRKFIETLNAYLDLENQPFINEREKRYLRNSIQIPICKSGLNKGQLVSSSDDLEFKRSGKPGLSAIEIKKLQASFHILSNAKKAGDTFQSEDFKQATIATIIACRLKSARLPKKALLPIGNLLSVERCIKSCLKLPHTNYTILATSILPEDDELKNYTYRSDVIFHRGDPEDVIRRYLDIAEKLNIDTILRITGDMPYVSDEIAEYLLHEHFESGADYTTGNGASIGTSVEVINTEALRKIKEHFKSANYSEYMTWYFQNNPEHFKLKLIDLPEKWARKYRLTLDYQEDLDLFNEIDSALSKTNPDYCFQDVIDLLDNSDLSKINEHHTLRFKTDPKLIDTLNEATKIKITET